MARTVPLGLAADQRTAYDAPAKGDSMALPLGCEFSCPVTLRDGQAVLLHSDYFISPRHYPWWMFLHFANDDDKTRWRLTSSAAAQERAPAAPRRGATRTPARPSAPAAPCGGTTFGS